MNNQGVNAVVERNQAEGWGIYTRADSKSALVGSVVELPGQEPWLPSGA